MERVEVRRGIYADSVTLMRVTDEVSRMDGVERALVALSTELNLTLLRQAGFPPVSVDSASQLLIAVRAKTADHIAEAIERIDDLLTRSRSGYAAPPGSSTARRHSTIGQAASESGPGTAIISVPGQYAVAEAFDALDAGCDVLLFSDNIDVEHEVLLKRTAAQRGLLVMGPDCGTAVIDGVGLGFANRVAPGRVGIVAASGTGCQQLLALLDAADTGVSAAIGVGGRDLSAPVAGRSTIQALRMLDKDPATDLIVVVSKSPAEEIAQRIRAGAAQLGTPVQFAFLGAGRPDITAAAEAAIRRLGQPVPAWRSDADGSRRPRRGWLRGMFGGGTLCEEALTIVSSRISPVLSNIASEPSQRVHALARPAAHLMIDFGADELTAGRAHPMIDPTLRNACLAQALSDPGTAVVLLDVVLGYGAHPDPAADLVPLLTSSEVPVIISLIGTKGDPQDLESTWSRLVAGGADVFMSNSAAARRALELLASGAEQ